MIRTRPPAVYAVDELIAELRPSELFVLCVARLWVAHHRNPGGSTAQWREGFAHMHIDGDSEAGFDRLFRLIAGGAIRSLDIRCQRCGHLGEDEGWLLQLVSMMQCDRLAEAVMILRDWLRPIAVAGAIGSARTFAAGFAERGLSIPLRHAQTAAARRPIAVTHAGCGSALLH